MRVIVFLVAILFSFGGARLSAQGVSLREKNSKLEKVFKQITNQTGYSFFYADGLLKKYDKVTVSIENASLEQALTLCFSKLPLTYAIVDKTIVVKEAIIDKPVAPVSDTNLLSPIKISGKVVNVKGEPLAAATIIEKGTKNATVANENGSFTITVSDTTSILIISYVHKESKEVVIGHKNNLTIKLQDAESKIEDVVVIGYEVVRPRDLMASVSSVQAKELKDNPLNSLVSVLQGRLAGVQISLSDGAPGAEATINIRGRNSITGDGSPLYIVDGMPVEHALDVLNPQDIESVYALKDAASTAIYGARGANGVLVITTKGGKNTNGKIQVSYNGSVGVQQLASKLDMMDPYEFVLYQWERALWRNDTSVISRYTGNMGNFGSIKNYYGKITGYDWQEKTMGRDALQHSNNISISRGDHKNTYNLSLTGNHQDGILLNSDLERRSANFKFDHKANSKLRAGFNFRYTYQRINGAGTSNEGGAGSNRLRNYIRYRPLLLEDHPEDFYDPNLDISNAGNGLNIINPLLLSAAEVRRRYTNVYFMSGYLQYKLVKNLQFRTTLGYDVTLSNYKFFDDTITLASKTNQKQPLVYLGNTSRKSFTNSNVFTYSNPQLFNSKHALTILLGQETQQSVENSFAQEIRWFPVGISADEAFNNLQLAATSSGTLIQPNPVSSEEPYRGASFFSTIDYNYDKRYLLKFTIRADGTSIFSPSNMWGYFPSVSFAWRLGNERFFSNMPFVNDLKLRLSYGTSGNNRIDPFAYRTTYVSSFNGGYGLNNILNSTFIPNNLGNERLKWEKIISQNIGIDASLLHNKFNISVDAYSNKSEDLLLYNAIPTSSGYTNQFQNIGTTQNKGIELQLSSQIVRKGDFSWNLDFNIAFNKNKVVSLGNNQQLLRNSGWFSTANFPADYILQVGKETGLMYGLVNDGFFTVDDFDVKPYSNTSYSQFQYEYTLKAGIADHSKVLSDRVQPGSPKFKDINGDGVIDLDNDRTIIGHAQPDFFGGFTQNFSYKNFDLSLFLNFSYGNDIFNANKLEYSNAVGNDINLLSIMKDRWKMIDANGQLIQAVVNNAVVGIDPKLLAETNAHAKIWFPSTGTVSFNPQKFAVEDGSYLRVNNVTLGYSLPKALLNRLKLNRLRFYITANNPMLFTQYTGFDPDVNARRNDPTTMGVDYSAYPRARTFVSGVNLTF
ncbi:TonB-dependent receptor [Chitinophagaceae bacterium LB-8]|uniref:TonB-dependent receptor n=1 Tax=Paraflavisolibacter caeni TaxID=2982496 RepID=A0A9X2XUI1_9BACT|nr:TonB-dependent receptor [Paraflavisolibacter caeni]MCU7547983.1 TonB-dependent receptor [Paraflavisolibacter caeni]